MLDFYTIFSIILTLAVLIGYINHHFIKIQTTIAITIGALIISFLLIIAVKFGFIQIAQNIEMILRKISFQDLLMNYMLSFLLFAGAICIDINLLKDQKWVIGTLAIIGTLVSTFLIAISVYFVMPLFNTNIDFIYCLLFGALISPTDPIAVLATFKELGAPKKLAIIAEGESLFNDGAAIVIFLTIYSLAFNSHPITFLSTTALFLKQTIGGIAYGSLLGIVSNYLIKPTHNHKLEVLITILIVTSGYTLAQYLDISGPLAMVVAGIFVGNYYRKSYTEKAVISGILYNFWELIEEMLNIILFLLIGLELLVFPLDKYHVITSLLAIPIVLLTRTIIVGITMKIFKMHQKYPFGSTRILVWGGIRGALALALALALPISHFRNIILGMTYAVVTFSIIVQGLTLKPVVQLSKREYDTKLN